MSLWRAVRHSGRCEGTITIWLAPVDAERTTVPVLTSLRHANPLIQALKSAQAVNGWVDTRRIDSCAHVHVAKASVGRTARLLHSLATDAAARGYQVRQGPRRPDCPGGLVLDINGHTFELTVLEETDSIPHQPTRAELAQAARSSWYSVPTNDQVPSGRLRLDIGHTHYDSMLAADRKRWTIEERLAVALRKLEDHAQDAEEQRVERQRQTDLREQARQRAQEVATELYYAHQREQALLKLVQRHTTAGQIREFLERVATVKLDKAGAEWLAWATGHADQLDPLCGTFAVPEIAAPSAGDLEPYWPRAKALVRS